MKLLTVMVNFRTAEMTFQSADALMRATATIKGARLVIVDNHSEDGSFEWLDRAVRQSSWKDRAEVLQTERNGGFGYGNNFAIRRNLASAEPADYFYLLNPDAYPEGDAVERMLLFLDQNPKVGIAGSLVQQPDKVPHLGGFRFPSLFSEFETALALDPVSRLLKDWIVAMPVPEQTSQVDWVTGASLMIRRETLQKVGLFDETFFLYLEETDLCQRARRAEILTYVVHDSVVTHIGGVSTGTRNLSRRMPRYWFESRQYYFDKHHGKVYRHAANAAWIAGRLMWHARNLVQKKNSDYPSRMLWDFIRYNYPPSGRRSGSD